MCWFSLSHVSSDCLILHMLHILDYILDILRLWVLFKLCGECWYFCFGRQLTWLGSGCKFQPALCGLWFQCQFQFQSFHSFIQICPTCMLLRGQCESWVVVSLLLEFSVFAMFLTVRTTHALRVHKQFYQVVIKNFSLLLTSVLILWDSLLKLHLEYWGFISFCHTLTITVPMSRAKYREVRES